MTDQPVSQFKKIQNQARALVDEQAVMGQEWSRVHPLRRFLHFWVLVVRSFIRNRCPVRASALAYSSVLALIPMLALVLSVTTSILKKQGEEPIRRLVGGIVQSITPAVVDDGDNTVEANDRRAAAREQAVRAREQAVAKINEFIDRTRSGTIGATSAVLLLFVAIAMLSRIENTFNDIWGVVRGRSWYMRVVLYWAAITLAPVLVISALGLTTAGQLHLPTSNPLHVITDLAWVRSLVGTFLPALVLSLTFAMMYLVMPNARVRLSAALVGGLTAGLLWHLNNKLGVLFVSRITSNNAVYGSLGIVPVVMIGMYIGWIILLFGSQVAYAYQNREAYRQERLAEGVNQRGREFAALRLVTRIGQAFQQREKPPSLAQLAEDCGVPTRLAGTLLLTLSQSRLVIEADRESGYAPARPLDQITVADILTVLRAEAGQELATREDDARRLLQSEMRRIEDAERALAGSITVEQLVERVPAGRPGAS